MRLPLSDNHLAQRLAKHQALIIKSGTDAFPAYPRGDRRKRPICWVSQNSFKALSSFGVLEQQGEGFAIARSFSKRSAANKNYANQHRDIEEREIFVQSGVKRPTRINTSLSALDRLYRRRDRDGQTLLSSAEYEAGRRYAQDYALAGYAHISTQNYQSAGEDKSHYSDRNSEVLNRKIDARRRLETADALIGRGLNKALIAVCCMDKSLSEVERAEKWAASSGLTILKMGLSALVDHYGTQAGKT